MNFTGCTRCSTNRWAMAFGVLGYGAAVVFEKIGTRGVLSFRDARNSASGFCAGTISGEWKAQATGICLARFPCALSFATAASTAARPPEMIVWLGELRLAIPT